MRTTFSDTVRDAVLGWLLRQRWFAGKGRVATGVGLVRELPLKASPEIAFQIIGVAYQDGPEELYLTAWPTAWRPWSESGVASETDVPDEWLHDHAARVALWRELTHGDYAAWRSPAFERLAPTLPGEVRLAQFDQSNTCLIVDDAIILKLYRKATVGENPDAEIGRFLAGREGAPISPPLYVVIETKMADQPIVLGTAHRFVACSQTAWEAALRDLADDLRKFTAATRLESVLTAAVEFAARLGAITARMHDLLADAESESFRPEPWTDAERANVAAGQIAYSRGQFELLAQRISALPPAAAQVATKVLNARDELLRRFEAWRSFDDCGRRIRIHGDYHLGQVLSESQPRGPARLWVLDFEGEPARPLAERRHKRSPLQDVAGMIRSLHYALSQTRLAHADHPRAAEFAADSYPILQDAFMKSYLAELSSAERLLPANQSDLRAMLDLYILEKAIYELGYELMNRPDWALVPLIGIQSLISKS